MGLVFDIFHRKLDRFGPTAVGTWGVPGLDLFRGDQSSRVIIPSNPPGYRFDGMGPGVEGGPTGLAREDGPAPGVVATFGDYFTQVTLLEANRRDQSPVDLVLVGHLNKKLPLALDRTMVFV